MEKIKTDYRFIEKVGELSEDGVAIYNIRLKQFVYLNTNFLNVFEMKEGPDLLFGKGELVLKHILSEDFNYLKSRFTELLATGCINTTEFRLKFENNSIKHLSCDVLVLENTDLLAAFVKDITKSKIHEDYLVKYTAQKDTMLDMLTHNLSGPLLLSKDVINSLQDGLNQNKITDIRKFISIIQENTQQCIDIVNDFLREEHNESARTYVKKTRFDVIEKIQVTLDKLIAMNDDKTFSLNVISETTNINSDPVKFFQVIHNILSNSIKFTNPGGSIKVDVSDGNDFYVIHIADDGIGIPDSLKPAIFQEAKGRIGLKGEKSTGLGLSIAKRLVGLMGGEVWFESEENSGSSFYVKLPKGN